MSVEDTVRTPVKGLRVRLRNKLKHECLVYEKFRVTHHRRFGLIVEGLSFIRDDYPVEFDGYPVLYK
jgi:hypothetical protein